MSELLNKKSSNLYCLEHPNIRLFPKERFNLKKDKEYCCVCLNTFTKGVLIEKIKPIDYWYINMVETIWKPQL
jgi:hypothetical protein